MDPDTLQRRHAERARDRRRRHRRRRVAAVGALVIVALAAGAAVTLGGGGGASPPRTGASAGTRTRRRSRTRGGQSRAAHRAPRAVARLGPPTGHPGDARVPILMYHVINPPPAGAPYPGLYVPRGEFAAQMHALHRAGWHAVTLDEVRQNWRHGDRLPAKPIVITFDNGYRSQYTNALPVLRRLGWAADENIQQVSGLPRSQGGLTTGEVRDLVRAGWELDTQGISHADLVELGAAQLHYQIDHERELLRRRYGVGVHWFCYPSGQYDPTVVSAVRAAGFVGSTTVLPGWASRADSPYALPRLRVLGGTSPSELLAQIAAARDDTPTPAADESSS